MHATHKNSGRQEQNKYRVNELWLHTALLVLTPLTPVGLLGWCICSNAHVSSGSTISYHPPTHPPTHPLARLLCQATHLACIVLQFLRSQQQGARRPLHNLHGQCIFKRHAHIKNTHMHAPVVLDKIQTSLSDNAADLLFLSHT